MKVAERFASQGVAGLFNQRRNNGRRKVLPSFRCRVAQVLLKTPEHFDWRRPTWTREILCLQMKEEGWPKVAVCTMGRVLACLGARLGMPKPVVLCPWKRDAREARLTELRALEARASVTEPVLYSDEVDVHLNPKIGRDWMLPRPAAPCRHARQEPEVLPGRRPRRPHRGGSHDRRRRKRTPGCSANSFGCWTRPTTAVRRIHLIVDNYGIHSARLTNASLAALKGRVVLHFLPPYCPDANRIERVWQDFHANVTRNHRCTTMKALLENAREYLQPTAGAASPALAALRSRRLSEMSANHDR